MQDVIEPVPVPSGISGVTFDPPSISFVESIAGFFERGSRAPLLRLKKLPEQLVS